MSLLGRLRGYKLRANIALGRQTWGRQGPVEPVSPEVAEWGKVEVPVHATISAVVIRADGTREELGELYSSDGVIDEKLLAQLAARAERGETP